MFNGGTIKHDAEVYACMKKTLGKLAPYLKEPDESRESDPIIICGKD